MSLSAGSPWPLSPDELTPEARRLAKLIRVAEPYLSEDMRADILQAVFDYIDSETTAYKADISRLHGGRGPDPLNRQQEGGAV
jgi:hypothetical protein